MKKNVWEEEETLLTEESWKKGFMQGIQAGIPLMIGYIPIAIAFVVIAKQAGVGWELQMQCDVHDGIRRSQPVYGD